MSVPVTFLTPRLSPAGNGPRSSSDGGTGFGTALETAAGAAAETLPEAPASPAEPAEPETAAMPAGMETPASAAGLSYADTSLLNGLVAPVAVLQPRQAVTTAEGSPEGTDPESALLTNDTGDGTLLPAATGPGTAETPAAAAMATAAGIAAATVPADADQASADNGDTDTLRPVAAAQGEAAKAPQAAAQFAGGSGMGTGTGPSSRPDRGAAPAGTLPAASAASGTFQSGVLQGGTAGPVPAGAEPAAEAAAETVKVLPSAAQPAAAAAAAPVVSVPAVQVAAPVPVQATVPAQPAPLLTQVAQPLFSLSSAAAGEHVMTLSVTPENLGPVTVRAHVSADGIRVELFAPNDAGREALRTILTDLRRDLSGSGMNASLSLSAQDQPGTEAEGRGEAPERGTARTGAEPDAGPVPVQQIFRPVAHGPQTTLDILA
ncbi:flagellar hook-length control protein FliK [Arthrobacter sp. BL-252-APC-1A]|uniref:flagellar hook-length control protein FliK n=1 Tax=Arthrobacter sp. BL-252-APC-1A TaxID=2606622 RepID=UPI0012B2D74B|nr:flagellar hook-length control protein FliK [Arthrobacter sp. BL-252-APC-1A]MSR99992.1 flagellar hook-length control protein FliK [Arthrobacter sp. BL-252-APC-1A]